MMESIKKNMVFVVGLAVLGGLGLIWFSRDMDESVPGDGIIEQPSEFAAVRAEILGTITTLRAVQFDISVLDDPAFQALAEAPKPPERPFTVSKRNPFLP